MIANQPSSWMVGTRKPGFAEINGDFLEEDFRARSNFPFARLKEAVAEVIQSTLPTLHSCINCG